MRGNKLQIKTRNEDEETSPEKEAPEPAEQQHEKDRHAEEIVPERGGRASLARQLPGGKDMRRQREDKDERQRHSHQANRNLGAARIT